MFVNPGKKIVIAIGDRKFARIPVKTDLITEKDKIEDVAKRYLLGKLEKNDTVFLSEKMVASLQGRALPLADIKPSKTASFLSRFVSRRPGGIGLAMPESMQAAIDEVGLWRILLACLAALITKPFGLKGFFYYIAGDGARSIDGPTANTIPPYNQCVVKGPKNSKQMAEKVAQIIKRPVAIVDVNDWGCRILGSSASFKANKSLLLAALKDNPLGQCCESTPIGILRPYV